MVYLLLVIVVLIACSLGSKPLINLLTYYNGSVVVGRLFFFSFMLFYFVFKEKQRPSVFLGVGLELRFRQI